MNLSPLALSSIFPSRFPALTAALVLLHAGLSSALAAEPDLEPRRVDARMMRQPDVSDRQISFVYAGDIWVAPKRGGIASRLSSPRGEESFPRFSPDGNWIAFSGNYDGNVDLYVVPTTGGVPRRITYHGAADRLVDWYPDGKHLLFATSRTSEKDRFQQFYKVPIEGGLPEKLPMPYGEFGAISPDGQTLAYTPISVDFRTWKRYRGGMNPDIWLFDLEKLEARNITQSPANDSIPMWHGTSLYFLSDRDENGRANIWVYDTATSNVRQITHFLDLDIHFPGIGPDELVFEAGGRLYLLDLASGTYEEVNIRMVTDMATLKPRLEEVSKLARNATVSPSGKRVLFEARGDVFSVPVEHGFVENLTHTPAAAERFPTWSPDGKHVAFFTDETGEYELALRNATNSERKVLSRLGAGFRYRPQWSPDSKKLVFIDQAMKIHLFTIEGAQDSVIGRQVWAYENELNSFRVSWSADSRWIAYAGDLERPGTAIVLHDTREGTRHQVTSGFYHDESPVFDPEGKYLYFRTSRSFTPLYSEFDNSWVYGNSANLAAVPLKKDTASPLAPRNDQEESSSTAEEKKDDSKKENEKDKSEDTKDKSDTDKEKSSDSTDKEKDKDQDKKKDEKPPKPVQIDLDDFERRVVILPPKPGRYDQLMAVPGKLIYRRAARLGAPADDDEVGSLVFWDLEKREEKTIIGGIEEAELSANREKILVRKERDYAIIEPKEGQKMDKKVKLEGLEARIDPMAEWKQLFADVWRFERDYFYDPNMHGVNWTGLRERYGKLLEDAVTRWDVNFVLGELISELNASHTYRGGGALESAPERGVGYLGCDFSTDQGHYRIRTILDGAPWDSEVRSPLRQPGISVKEGDYLLAVNRVPLDTSRDPWAAFQGLADKTVLLTINDKPGFEGARDVLVQTLSSEYRLRHLAWIESNRKKVDSLSEGRVGYIYVPDTARNGQTELVRQWQGQVDKLGLVIDERFNSGGQIPDRFIELLNRPRLNYWGVRDGKDWSWPPVAHPGPKAMLVNGWSGSGGDCLPFYFKQANLGPLIGTRTWGGLIGISGVPALTDGGFITVPTFSIYDTNGNWIIEGHGVEPDIEVIDDPGQMARGKDPQLERAVSEILEQLRKTPPPSISKPAYPNRARFLKN